MNQEKESFISSEDRPTLSLKPDTPITELHVRDLQFLINNGVLQKSHYDTFGNVKYKYESGFKFEKPEKYEKNEKSELPELPPGFPVHIPGPDPRVEQLVQGFDQVIRTMSGLTEQVHRLTKEIEALKQ